MQRYFVSASQWVNDHVNIINEDVHHVSRVMRKKIGDEVICVHPDGRAAKCAITGISPQSIELQIQQWLEHNPELPIAVTIAQGLPKSDKMALILQKGTELGAAAFIPFRAERSVVKWDGGKMAKKTERFTKILKEASEQSHRSNIPVLHDQMNIDELMIYGKQFDTCIFAYEEEAKVAKFNSFSTIMKEMNKGQSLLACIGPEGGFTSEEAQQLKESGFQPVRLGPRILRTETAAMYILAGISYQFEN
ncbi:16S rRNA (uracil(1498)-N(3))-methyltransferase [Virgibacillus halophilus]|uniref:16S rRNA (uracil(1498)-N(3))-methyltransferase n=1 Tax=Tigheibacillus halophilus TaxID=361280 RepID=UPI00362D7D48